MSTKSPVQDNDHPGSTLAIYGGKIMTTLEADQPMNYWLLI